MPTDTDSFAFFHTISIAAEAEDVPHIDNIRFFQFIQDARLAYFDAAGCPGHDPVTNTGHAIVVNHCEYIGELIGPDTLSVGVKALTLGSSSIKLAFRLFSERQQRVVAEAYCVAVLFDFANHCKLAISNDLRERIKLLETTAP